MTSSQARLLAAGLGAFSANGFAAASVADVCATAGVAKPTLYHFFGSKEGLFAAVVREHGAGPSDRVAQASRYDGDVTTTLRRLAGTYLDVGRTDQDLYRLLLLTRLGPPTAAVRPALDVLDRWNSAAVSLFSAAARDHGNMRGRESRYAASFRGLVDAYVGLCWSGEVDPTDPLLVPELVHQFMHGIFS